ACWVGMNERHKQCEQLGVYVARSDKPSQLLMSVVGQSRPFGALRSTSGMASIADSARASANVREVPEGDMAQGLASYRLLGHPAADPLQHPAGGRRGLPVHNRRHHTAS